MHVKMRETLRWILWTLGLLPCVQYAWCERPEKVTLCDIKDNPTSFNHKLVEVEGFLSHNFEDFSISTPECPYSPAIWLEYGGKRTSGTIYCCGGGAERTRTKQLEVEGFSVPLVEDRQFRKFDKLIQPPFRSGNHGSVVHATIIGRFFLGEKQSTATREDGAGAVMVILAVAPSWLFNRSVRLIRRIVTTWTMGCRWTNPI